MTTATVKSGHRNGAAARSQVEAVVPPQDLAAEMGVLGSIFFDNSRLDEVAAVITAEHFYLQSHQRIYAAIVALSKAGKPFDAVTVGEQIEKSGTLKDIGGYDCITQIIESVPHAAHARHYAELVREKYLRRQAIAAAVDLQHAAHDAGTDLDESVTTAESRLHGIIEAKVAEGAVPVEAIALAALERIQSPKTTATPTGFFELDALLGGGLRAGQLVVVGARPSVGKSAFACGSLALQVAAAGVPTLIFSLEMSSDELFERWLCAATNFGTDYLRSGQIQPAHHDTITEAANKIAALPLLVDDCASRTISQLAAAARVHRRREKIGLAIVDYIQLLSPEDRKVHREQQVAEISRGLKLLARSLEIPVVVLAQLNRAVEARDNKRPRLSDLRESGAIEQDADIVMFLDRPALYDPKASPAEAHVIVAKHRSGKTGDVQLVWDATTMRFRNHSLYGTGEQFF